MAGRLSWERMDPFGYRLEGDLAVPLETDEQAALGSLYHEDGLVVSNGQRLDTEQHRRLVGYLGRLADPKDYATLVSVNPAKAGAQRGSLEDVELPWHIDAPFLPRPYPALSLHALEVVNDETATFYASGRMAYVALSDEVRARLADLRTLIGMPVHPEGRFRREHLAEVQEDWPVGMHPLVKHHAVTGAPYLYVAFQGTIGIEGWDDEASEALLEELLAVYYRQEAVYEHRWRNGDLVIWDNLMVSHRRSDLAGIRTRTLQRVQLSEGSFTDSFPNFVPTGNYLKKLFGSYQAPAR
jgi:taurine dioxygenase